MYTIDFKKPVHVYFMGIGGISMSGLAQILMQAGFTVSGSDMKSSSLTDELTAMGAHVYIGQKAENITPDLDVVVYTAAIRPDNPEYMAMQALDLPSLTRAELLGQLMCNYKFPIAISGTHGKTTTTSMASEVLLAASKDPTISIGGILPSIGSNCKVGGNEYFVTEACEYTNSFLSFYPKISIILNIEEDHLDFFKDLDDITNSFHQFASLLPQDGTLIIQSGIADLDKFVQDLQCRIITFGLSGGEDYSACDLSYDEAAHASFRLVKKGIPTEQTYTLAVPGEHNIVNSLSVIALADLLELDSAVVAQTLASFRNSERRFQYKGNYQGVTVIDDYAHHPTEIEASLKTAQNVDHNTLWCIFQPHTYTRTKAFLTDFAKALSLADKVILADIYAARETDTLGVSSADIMNGIRDLGTDCYYFHSFEEIKNFVRKSCTKGDLLITMGAGDVYKIGEELLIE